MEDQTGLCLLLLFPDYGIVPRTVPVLGPDPKGYAAAAALPRPADAAECPGQRQRLEVRLAAACSV